MFNSLGREELTEGRLVGGTGEGRREGEEGQEEGKEGKGREDVSLILLP